MVVAKRDEVEFCKASTSNSKKEIVKPKMEFEVADKLSRNFNVEIPANAERDRLFRTTLLPVGALEICGTRGVEVGKDIDADNTEVSNKRLCPSRDLGRR